MSALQSVVVGVDARHLLCKKSYFTNNLTIILQKMADFCGRSLRLYPTYHEQRTSEGVSIVKNSGLIDCVKYCPVGYFYDEKLMRREVLEKIVIRAALTDRAAALLTQMAAENRRKIFVHVRRGDYTIWPDREFPAVLPFNWYRQAMDHFRNRYDDPLFLVFSDDTHYVDELFGGLQNVWISRQDQNTDFALMSLCTDGILSASSFAWWAAHFSRRASKDGIYVAPTYWAGHRRQEWYPQGFGSTWIDYLPVSSSKAKQ